MVMGMRRMISSFAHDDAICRRIENSLNSLIDAVKQSGGMVWIQSKENKEHFYKLTDYVSVGFFTPCEVISNEDMD